MIWKYTEKVVLRNRQNNFKNWFSELFSLPRNWFRTELREFAFIFDARNGILSIFLFHGTVRNRIPRNCFFFRCTAQNFEHFSLPRNGLERNSETYLFHGTARIPPEQTNCSVYSVFLWIFCRTLPTLIVPVPWQPIGTSNVNDTKTEAQTFRYRS